MFPIQRLPYQGNSVLYKTYDLINPLNDHLIAEVQLYLRQHIRLNVLIKRLNP